jgi:hypothetical protein
MTAVLANVAAFQIGWFALILGAARGHPELGVLIGLAIVGWHLLLASDAAAELRLVALSAVVGAVFDSALAALGLIQFDSGTIAAWLAPPWMVVLWMVFATTLNVSLRWLKGRRLLGAVLGATAGPLAYYAGVRLGAAHVPDSMAGTLLAVAIIWGIALPLLVAASERYDGAGHA